MNYLFDGPEGARTTILLAHGAGAPMDSAWMNASAGVLAQAGFRVARFEFGYMAGRRTDAGRKPPPRAEALIEEYRSAVAGMVRPALSSSEANRWAVASPACLRTNSSPLAGSRASCASDTRSTRRASRNSCARNISAALKVPALICQGTRDIFGAREEVAGYGLSKKIEILWLEDGDHDLKPRKGVSGFTAADHLKTVAEAVTAWAGKLTR